MPDRVPALTGLRGIAALWVCRYHLDRPSAGTRPFLAGRPVPVVGYGWLGVDLFFLLSGFVLMLFHARQFARSPLHAAPGFMLARFWRIHPLNAVATGVVALFVLPDPMFADVVRADRIGNLTPGALVRTLTLTTRW